jgi:exosome complex component RRP45
MTALRHFRKPEVEVIGDEVIVVRAVCCRLTETLTVALAGRASTDAACYTSHPALHLLCILRRVRCILWSGLTRSLQPIIDPTHIETIVSSGSLTLTLNPQRELCVLSKAGGTPLAAQDIMSAVRVGVDRVRDLVKIMESALEADRASRVVEVR